MSRKPELLPEPAGHGYASFDPHTLVHIYDRAGVPPRGDMITASHSYCAEPLNGFMAWREVSENRICPKCWDAWHRLSLMAACARAGMDYFDFCKANRFGMASRERSDRGGMAAGLVKKYKIQQAAAIVPVPRVTVELYAQDVKIKRTIPNAKSRTTHGTRGAIVEFSRKSLRNMVFSVRNMPVPLTHMMTLTYPREFPADGREVKRHWNVFLTGLRRRYPGIAGVWFLEFQDRGAPHLHVLLAQPVAKMWVSKVWYRVVGTGDVLHLAAGTRVEVLREVHAASAYASKYAAKSEQKDVPEGFQNVGRFWGVFGTTINAEQIITADARKTELPAHAPVAELRAAEVARYVRQVVRAARHLVTRFRARMGFKARRVDNHVSGFTAYGFSRALRPMLAALFPPNKLVEVV